MNIYESFLWLVYKGYVVAFFAGVIVCNSVHMLLNTNQIRWMEARALKREKMNFEPREEDSTP